MRETDEELIREYIAGNQEALKILIERYTPEIYNFVIRFVGATNAPDVTQDVFIKVWRNIKKFKVKRAQFKTWLFTIARNTTTDFLRKKKSTVFSDLDTEEDSFSESIQDETILPDVAIVKLEDTKLLNELLSQLPTDYQTVLMLYYQEDMTFKEIGKVLGKPLNTVKNYHFRAIKRLRGLLDV